MNSESISSKLSELEQRKAQLAASKRMLEATEAQVGLTDQQIREAAEKLSTANLETPAGLRMLLSVVLRVNVYADRIEVITFLGGDGKSTDLKAAAKKFINTISAASAASHKSGTQESRFLRPAFIWFTRCPGSTEYEV